MVNAKYTAIETPKIFAIFRNCLPIRVFFNIEVIFTIKLVYNYIQNF